MVTEAEEGLPGLEGKNIFTTNNMGFRGGSLRVPKPAGEYRIFLIGGSSAETLYLDDNDALNSVLQKELGERLPDDIEAKVYNAGKSGDATPDHISMLVHRIVHLEPDLVIVFAGINDLSRSIYKYDYLHYVEETPDEGERDYPALKFLATELQIARRIFYMKHRITPRTETEALEEIRPKTNYGELVELCKSAPVSDDMPGVDPDSFRDNLKTIIGIARAHGVRLLLMTQQTTWNSAVDPEARDRHWMLLKGGVAYREDLMDEALGSLNDVTRELAEEFSVPLYDLAVSIPKSLEYFYDDVHFNVKGSRTAGRELALLILDLDLIQPGTAR
jgi:lysophospholipase L1-like esterase